MLRALDEALLILVYCSVYCGFSWFVDWRPMNRSAFKSLRRRSINRSFCNGHTDRGRGPEEGLAILLLSGTSCMICIAFGDILVGKL